MSNKLGILAGGGPLPARLVEHCRASGRGVFVLGIEGQTDSASVSGVEHAWVRLGAADEAIRLLRAAGVRELVMIGGVRRPSMAELKPDWRAARAFARIGLGALGDDGILKLVRDELEAEGFSLLGVDQVLNDLLAREGVYGRHHPDSQAQADIAHGLRVAAELGALDTGQAVVVQQGLVLGVEAIEGTDALLGRCAGLRREGPGGVLVKARKPRQDRRLDLPTIGPRTIEQAAAAGLRGVAVEAGGSLVLDKPGVIALADRLGLFVLGTPARSPLFYLIAGEPSGDAIGAGLMRALGSRTGGAIRFAGIGGELMEAEGLQSLIPIRELAVMGVLEVLPAARRLLRRIRQTVAEIERLRPAAIVTIDSSGFCFQVARRVRAKPRAPLIVHYVAPMVWAWRAHRARVAARSADHLLTLLPFEPPLFAKAGLPASYVGHPVVESGADRGDGPGFRARHGIAAEAPVLCVLPGSRGSEVRRLMPVFRLTVERLLGQFPGLVVVMPTVATVEREVAAATADWPGRTIMLRGTHEKFDAFAASAAALAASGTVALELAMADVPMVIAYRIWPPTAWILQRVVKLRWANLVNILLERGVVPEFLQEKCTPERLAAAVAALLSDPAARAAQIAGFDEALRRIGRGGDVPSIKAADRILELLAARPGEAASLSAAATRQTTE